MKKEDLIELYESLVELRTASAAATLLLAHRPMTDIEDPQLQDLLDRIRVTQITISNIRARLEPWP